MSNLLQRFEPLATLVLRLWVGLNLSLAHGLGKLQDPGGFLAAPAMELFPLPVVSGWFAILAEVVGGLLLAIGLFTRWAALAVVGTMLGAALIVHQSDPWNNKEFALGYAVMALYFLVHGGGRYALDSLLRRRSSER